MSLRRLASCLGNDAYVLLTLYAPQLAAQRRSLAAEICVTAMMALIARAVAEKLAGRYDRALAIFAELRLLLVAYSRAVSE